VGEKNRTQQAEAAKLKTQVTGWGKSYPNIGTVMDPDSDDVVTGR
jgi:hypothetical protein